MSRSHRQIIHAILSFVALIQLFTPKLSATVDIEKIFDLDFTVDLYITKFEFLHNARDIARFGEDQNDLNCHFKNRADIGLLCANSLRLLETIYQSTSCQTPHENISDNFHRACTQLLQNTTRLKNHLASHLETLDDTGRLRFYTTYFINSDSNLYRFNPSEWKNSITKNYPVLCERNNTTTRLGLDALRDALNNAHTNIAGAITIFKNTFITFAQELDRV